MTIRTPRMAILLCALIPNCTAAEETCNVPTECQEECDAGSAAACSTLGYAYMEGQGVTKDDDQAVTLFKKACDSGNAYGCSNLGFMVKDGRGISKSLETSMITEAGESCELV